MKRNTIRWVVILAAASIIGIIVTQIYWVNKAYELREKQFIHRVDLALNDVMDNMVNLKIDSIGILDPVLQLSPSHFVVELNEFVELNMLESLLKSSFKENKVGTDFEYGVYDCIADTFIKGRYIKFDSLFVPRKGRPVDLPAYTSQNSFFSVYFPEKNSYLMGTMGFWTFSSIILFIVIIFFASTTFIILKQKKLSEITRDFINNMTHEFKTPISTISVSSEVIMNPGIVNDPERLRKYAAIINTENNRLKKQVEKVLQIATLETEDLRLHKEEIDLHKVIRNAVRSLEVALDEIQGKVKTSFQAQQSFLFADKVHLTNIIYNLVDNAIKYARETPLIEIRTRNTKNGICVEISDNGIGISQQDQKHVFKKFFRVSTGNRHDVKGFGLGLSYVKMMVEAHNGSIKLESEPGMGSTFIILLPYK